MHPEVNHRSESRAPVPRLVFWELTKGCNLRCLHCRASAQELASPLDLDTADALKVIDKISAYARPVLVLSGGEPLFRKDIFALAAYATERGLPVALASNGTLITPEVASRLRACGIRRVAISFDGADAETHDRFRGQPGAFEAALRGLLAAQGAGLSTQINTTVTRRTAPQLPRILQMAVTLGVDALHTFLLVPVGCGADLPEDEMVPADEYEKILNWFYDREKEGVMELKATCAPHYYRVRKQREVEERRAGRDSTPGTVEARLHPPAAPPPLARPGSARRGAGCLAGSGVCFVSHRGEVYPCGYLPVKAGDLTRQSFAEIWEESPVFAILRDPDSLKGKCRLCEFRKLCLGCRARAYAATGDFLAEEPVCAYRPRALRPDSSPPNPHGRNGRPPLSLEVIT
ncbi:MAG: radical SAM protein [Candidatus Acidiferrales bacterium]